MGDVGREEAEGAVETTRGDPWGSRAKPQRQREQRLFCLKGSQEEEPNAAWSSFVWSGEWNPNLWLPPSLSFWPTPPVSLGELQQSSLDWLLSPQPLLPWGVRMDEAFGRRCWKHSVGP